MENTSIREKLLKTYLKQQVEEQYKMIDSTKYHHCAINGFYTSLTKIMLDGMQNPKKDDNGLLKGYHIHSKLINNFERNKLVKDIGIKNILYKANNATYHANNSRGASNGYPYWYIFSDWIGKANQITNYRLEKMIKHNKKYAHTGKKYKQIINDILTIGHSPRDKRTIDYIKIDKLHFIQEYKLFRRGLSEQFSIVLNQVFYWDKNSVYVDNTIYNESMDGYGRVYTLVGLLSKELRKRLLSGHVELDIETTAQWIFLNLYYMNTIKGSINTDLKQWHKDFPEHYKLVTDKKKFRYKIASLFHTDVQTAKKIITHLTYSPNANILHAYANDKAPSIKAKIKVGIKPFIREAKILRKSILEKFYYQEDDHNPHLKIGNLKLKEFKPIIDEEIRVNNLKLKGNGRGKKLDDRRTSRISELVEHQIRERMIALLEYYSEDNIYQVHDALIIRSLPKELDINTIQRHIKEDLGFNISISSEIY